MRRGHIRFKVDGYTVFIQIRLVHDDVEQRDLPPEKRIPHCLEAESRYIF